MLDFKPLALEDKELIDTYIKPYNFLTCEYTFITLYMWRKASNISYCIYKNALILKKNFAGFGSFFMQPLGYKKDDLSEIIEVLIEYKNTTHMEYLFRNIEAPFVNELKSLPIDKFIYGIEENNFDYIYESENLISLPGRKLSSKRNHISRFLRSYNYTVSEITFENTQKCIEASKEWCDSNGNTGLLAFEHEAIIDMLKHRERLDFEGIVVFVDDKLSAFTMGERVNEDMAIIYIEKALPEIHGLYTFINRTFVESHFKDVKFINREDDMGIEGLRKAKQSYHPYKLEYKHTITLT
jgi:hypothetical protein